jgi:protein-tyrosine phosphatase
MRQSALDAMKGSGLDHSQYCRTALDENMKKHRFDIMAYDRNRVIIDGNPQRYVNASYVREGAGGRWWIAAEVSPVVHTVVTAHGCQPIKCGTLS